MNESAPQTLPSRPETLAELEARGRAFQAFLDSLPTPTVKDLRCPVCGQEDAFVIEVSERLLMFADGVVLHGETGEQWDETSHCRCYFCQHASEVMEFHKDIQDHIAENRKTNNTTGE